MAIKPKYIKQLSGTSCWSGTRLVQHGLRDEQGQRHRADNRRVEGRPQPDRRLRHPEEGAGGPESVSGFEFSVGSFRPRRAAALAPDSDTGPRFLSPPRLSRKPRPPHRDGRAGQTRRRSGVRGGGVGVPVRGVALGTASGLVPGLHANNFALLLAGLAPSVSADPLLVGVAMLGAGVVHSFLDIVPALALGVPDAATAVAALPGHRLVVAGGRREAVRLSAVGSGLAVALAVPLAIPITWVMIRGYPL